MVNGAPHRWTISPQPHGPRWSDVAAPLGAGTKPAGGAAAVRRGRAAGAFRPGSLRSGDLRLRPGGPRSQRAPGATTAGRPARPGNGWRLAAGAGTVSLELTALGQPRLMLKGQPGPAVSFSQAAGRLWAALTPAGQVGVDVALPSEFEAGYPMGPSLPTRRA